MHPIVLARDEGERVSKHVVIKLDREELCATESLYPPGRRGPEPHIHKEHFDAFYVVEGELVFHLVDEEYAVQAGGFVMSPPGLVHTFRNDGPEPARFINLHAPSKDFGDYMRGKDDAHFDTYDPPEDGGLPIDEATLLRTGEGETLAMGPSSLTFKAERGDLSLSEQILGAGFPGPVPHTHAGFTDSFYLLEGTLSFLAGDDWVDAGPGTWVSAPPGAVHTFSNRSDGPVRSLNLMAPGGFEQYLREVVQAASGGPPDPAAMAEIASRHDFRPV